MTPNHNLTHWHSLSVHSLPNSQDVGNNSWTIFSSYEGDIMGQYSSGLPNMWRFGEDMQMFEWLNAKLLNKFTVCNFKRRSLEMLKCCLFNLREGNIIEEEAILKEAYILKLVFEGTIILHVSVCEKKTHKLGISCFCYIILCLAMFLHNFTYPRTLLIISLPTRWLTSMVLVN